ncbi:type I polyketide synthase [Nocardia sp. NPDC051570]|uniref:type I polyketide synthase n=1 Tax=Nocardia sp. NPDC051570 TaxID=3364324 RepID=UPI0037B02F8D
MRPRSEGDLMSASAAVPIAVVGIGCRFPGGVSSASELWQLAAHRRSTVGPVPPDRWDADGLARLHDPELAGRAGRGCFLDGDVWAWDPQALSVAPTEQEWVDPQFRVLAETAWEAVEHAGIPVGRLRGTRTGVYMGTYAPDNLMRDARPVENTPNSAYLFGNFTASAAGRVAFAMDLRGPSMVVSTHCSSGLVALDTACGALTLGDCDTALAGAVLLMLSPSTHYCEAPLLLSPRGACHAFDVRADGYVRGEGAAVVVLKRLADARREGDHVLAVIRGSAVNNDGQSTRLTAPSTVMQRELFFRAVDKAQIDPGEVGLVEAHGPGTAVGDPVEYSSIDAVYGHGRGRCALGSIKTNIGHSEPVSGLAGLIKTVECLHRGLIPPNLNFQEWNPSIPRDTESRLFIPTELTPWPVPEPARLAVVSSYGVTGTNAHVVVEAAPTSTLRPRRSTSGALVFTVSGASAGAAAGAAGQVAEWLAADGETELLDLAHTLALRRSATEHRVCVVAADRDQLIERARAFTVGDEAEGVVSGVARLAPDHPGPVFVFTGQGSQRPGMCRGLLDADPAFAAAIAEIEPLIAAEAGFSVREMICAPKLLVGLDRVQPTLFAVQVALARTWRSWGVEPAAVIGQSLGEVAACVVAGGLDLIDGVRVICRRSALLATISGGAMASVMLDATHVQAAIDAADAHGVTPAVLTSPGITVISGDAARIGALVEQWDRDGVVAKMIDVDVASHSPQVDPILDQLRAVLADVPVAHPQLLFLSTVSDDPVALGSMDADYWVRNQRQPVRFHGAVSAALRQGYRLFVECTPHPLAVRPILDTAGIDGISDAVAVGSLREGVDDITALLTHVGAIHVAGHQVDWSRRYGDGDLVVDAPGTYWERTRHGGDSPVYRLVHPALVGADQHPLLGGHVTDPDTPDRHLWQTPVSPQRLAWLGDHRVAGVAVLPGTAMVEMILAAGRVVFGVDRVVATDVQMTRPLVLEPEPVVTVRLTRHGERADVDILTGPAGAVTVHAHGSVHRCEERDTATGSTRAEEAADWTEMEPADLHRIFRDKHDVYHGPAFTAITRVQIDPNADRVLASMRLHDDARVSAAAMLLHPALADQAVQVAVAAWIAHYPLDAGPVVVAGFDEVRIYGPTGHTRSVTASLRRCDDLGCDADVVLATVDGRTVAELRGLRVRNVTPPAQRFTGRLAHLAWDRQPIPAPRRAASDSTWLLIDTDDCSWLRDLARELKQRTRGCRIQSAQTALSEECTAVVVAIGGDRATVVDPARTAMAVTAQMIRLLQHLAEAPHPPRVWIVNRAADPDTCLVTAGIRGLLRVAAYEHPELILSSIHATDDTTDAAIADELLDHDLPITEIALTPTERRVARVYRGAPPDPVPGTQICSDSAYLVTGGLGGLGRLSVDWLARRGARRVVVCARTALDEAARARLDRRDIELEVVTGDIADPAIAAHAVAVATRDGVPLRGVLHAAAVIDDAILANIDDAQLEGVWQGKAAGAWALHEATERCALDFFVVYTSVAALIGSPGQGAYAAANAFTDALVAWRHARGLPATSIWWGAWAQVGRGRHLLDRGFVTISPTDGIDALERILTAGYTRLAYSPLDLDRWTAPFPQVGRSTLLSAILTGPGEDTADLVLREQLTTAATAGARRDILEGFIIDTIRELLGGTTHHIGPHTSMVMLGLDSLAGVQLQQSLQRALGTEMKPGVIWVTPTAAALATWLLQHLGLHSDHPNPTPAPETVAAESEVA